MGNSKKVNIILSIVLLVLVVLVVATPLGKTIWNGYKARLDKADEVSYETMKKVEDTARAYIASYKSDVDIYHTYCDSEDPKKQEYAESARIRAITTANSYNEYLRKNSYVWKDNMPSDLPQILSTDF